MQRIQGATFMRQIDRGGAVVRDVELEDCLFDNCGFSITADASQRSRLVDANLVRCRSFNSSLGPAELIDVVIDDLRANDLMICWFPVFRRVRLRGKITSLKINSVFSSAGRREPAQRLFEEAASRFYTETDWALDITEARLSTFEVEGIPTKLIRYDPSRALVVSRGEVQDGAWRDRVADWNTHWTFVVDMFAEGDEPSILLAAPYGKRRLREGLDNLRDVGLGRGRDSG